MYWRNEGIKRSFWLTRGGCSQWRNNEDGRVISDCIQSILHIKNWKNEKV